jgi:phenylpropionate dioxygenase-like ring-hydroxylating dioxygenase large terminal subunit
METVSADRAESASVVRSDWSSWPRYDTAALGFREYWYPAMASSELGRRAVSRTLLGDRVIFIREKGQVRALSDRCLHRGVPLSLTANRFGGMGGARQEFPGTLTCGYHGWTYDLDSGLLVAALTDGPDSPICGKVRLRTYPVAERVGWIWIYMGDGEPPPVETDIPRELLAGPFFRGVRATVRQGNWRYALENAIDEAHPRYLHREALWRYFKKAPPAWNRSRVDLIEDGRYVTYTPQDVHFDDEYPGLGKWPRKRWFQRGDSAVQRVAVGLPCLVRVNQPGYTIFSWYVPVDADHHTAIQTVVKFGAGPAVWRFKLYYWLFYRWIQQVMFGNQDYQMIKATDAPPERLFRPDLSILAWRQMCEQARGGRTGSPLLRQIQEEEAACSP